MQLSALSSGSSGNCFYVENKNSAILIDAGISSKQIVERLASIKKSPERIKAIFITHEHSDHVKGADVFARQFNIPVFATKGTAESCFLCQNENLINIIKNDELIKIKNLSVKSFSKFHKAEEPVSYSITGAKTASIITDLGCKCENSASAIESSDFLFLESNHDIKMLDQGPYPYFLKQWIKSNQGHLSNLQASLAVLEHGKKKLKNIVLSHLSETNNTPLLALTTFSGLIKERRDLSVKIHLSLREHSTDIFKI